MRVFCDKRGGVLDRRAPGLGLPGHQAARSYFGAPKSSGNFSENLKWESLQLFPLLRPARMIDEIFRGIESFLNLHLAIQHFVDYSVSQSTASLWRFFTMALSQLTHSILKLPGTGLRLRAVPIEQPEIKRAPEPRQRSIVGTLVANMHSQHTTLSNRRDLLACDIERLTEELRQTNIALDTLASGLTALGEDPALSEEERTMAGAPLANAVDRVTEEIMREAELLQALEGL